MPNVANLTNNLSPYCCLNAIAFIKSLAPSRGIVNMNIQCTSTCGPNNSNLCSNDNIISSLYTRTFQKIHYKHSSIANENINSEFVY